MKKVLIGCGALLAVFLLLAFILGSWVMGIRNRMVTMDEGVKAQWAQVENQLKRRFDLIPNLVETVKGYAKHEKEIFINIAKERSKLAGAKTLEEKVDASSSLNNALARLLVIVERYPDLKANQSFMRLMDELSGTENRIAVERMRYNDTVQTFNKYIRLFPNSFFASIFRFTEKPYFEVGEAEKEAPKVKF